VGRGVIWCDLAQHNNRFSHSHRHALPAAPRPRRRPALDCSCPAQRRARFPCLGRQRTSSPREPRRSPALCVDGVIRGPGAACSYGLRGRAGAARSRCRAVMASPSSDRATVPDRADTASAPPDLEFSSRSLFAYKADYSGFFTGTSACLGLHLRFCIWLPAGP
jgi:hypothetical protein